MSLTPAAEAHARFDALFDALQQVQQRIQAARAAGRLPDDGLQAEWDTAYAAFMKAYQEWRLLEPSLDGKVRRGGSERFQSDGSVGRIDGTSRGA
jgi:hypothetical protein